MGTYVIGDVHGCYKELMLLLNNIEKIDTDANYIFVGDLLDRGPGNIEMARWAFENISKNGKYRSVCGNHDAGITDWYQDLKKGFEYRYQYGTELRFFAADKENLLYDYCEFVKTFPLYIEEEINGKKFVIAHGYVPENYKKYDPYEQKEDIRSLFYWDRAALYGAESPVPGVTVVCGHNPVILPEWISYHPNHELCTVYKGESLVNVDTGCFHSGLLSAYRLEDGCVFYSGIPGRKGFEERKKLK